MKKVIFGAAALLFTGALMAQTTFTDNKDGAAMSSEQADPALGAVATANRGESSQEGNTNKLSLRQAGTNQSAFTYQENYSADAGNQARIWQTGAVQATSGVDNDADVRQIGTANNSLTRQEGDGNDAVTRQGLKNATLGVSEGNFSSIRQGTGQQAQDNYALVEQDGMSNAAYTRQTYDNSEARTVQEGDLNVAKVLQDAGPNQTDGHKALAEQYGDSNAILVDQSGAGASNEASVIQSGDGNRSVQTQVNTAAAGGLANSASVNQGANSPASGAFTLLDSTVDDVDNGSANLGAQDAIAIQTQTGEHNNAESDQFGDSNYSEQVQTGLSNDGYIYQNAYGNPNGGSNFAKQVQNGEHNQAALAQNGSNHLAQQNQTGWNNVALSTQRGDSNLVNTHQFSTVPDRNTVETAQRGHDNQILVVQRDGQSFIGHQNLVGGQPDGGNVMDVLQLGPNGDFSTDGVDCNFDTALDPTISINTGFDDINSPCDDC